MDKNFRKVFDKIQAGKSLKENTVTFLQREISKQNSKKRVRHFRLATVCASFVLLLLVGGFSYNLYFTPNAYIDIDVNPSIELTINRFGRVIEANPYNDDGATILNEVNILHLKYGDAVDKLLESLSALGYMKQDSLLSVTVQSNDNETNLLSDLAATFNNSLQEHHSNSTTDIFPVTEGLKKYAHDNKVSPAKYLAIMQLQEVDPTASFDSCSEHSISELKALTQEHGNDHHNENPTDYETQPSGNSDTNPEQRIDSGSIIPQDSHHENSGHGGENEHH